MPRVANCPRLSVDCNQLPVMARVGKRITIHIQEAIACYFGERRCREARSPAAAPLDRVKTIGLECTHVVLIDAGYQTRASPDFLHCVASRCDLRISQSNTEAKRWVSLIG